MELRCQHCGHVWDYRGRSKYYASCPRCLWKVSIQIKRKKRKAPSPAKVGAEYVNSAKFVEDYLNRLDWRVCYDAETEVLTKSGWKKFSELRLEDEILTINVENRSLEYQRPVQIYEFDYDGEMISIGSSCTEEKEVLLTVTPEHRMLVEKSWCLDFKPAKEISEHTPIPVRGVWNGGKVDYFKLPLASVEKRSSPSYKTDLKKVESAREKNCSITRTAEGFDCAEHTAWTVMKNEVHDNLELRAVPELSIKMDDWLRFLGIYLGGGRCSEKSEQCLKRDPSVRSEGENESFFVQATPSKREAIREVLGRLPFPFTEVDGGFRIHFKQLWSYLRSLEKDQEKFIPAELKQLSPHQLEMLWDGLVLSGGYVDKRGRRYFCTSSKQLADDVQEILLKMGKASTLRKIALRHTNKHGDFSSRRAQLKSTVYVISELKCQRYYVRRVSRVPYRGKVYCVKVPNRTVCVRRGGKPVFSGNSENANVAYSFSSMFLQAAGEVITRYTLSKVYPREIAQAHIRGDFHIHNLPFGITGYCAGWSIKDLLLHGFGGVPGRTESSPPRHFSSALLQISNFLGSIQNEWAGAQAVNSLDIYLAPFVRKDGLSYKQVKQAMQEFIYNLNISSRWGSQTPFTNVTFELKVPEDMKEAPVVRDGKLLDETYADYQPEADLINRAFLETMLYGDMRGRIFTFPIPTYNITRDFDWDSETADLLFAATAKFGIPYFQNCIKGGIDPHEVRAMCCRLMLDMKELYKRYGGYFGYAEKTGSIGVVTINIPRLGYLSRDERDFFERLERLMELAKQSLEIKRKLVEQHMKRGLLPFSARYLGTLKFHFSTIGLIGMHEACLNFLGKGIQTETGKDFAIKVLKFMRERLVEFQDETGNLYNLEATPAEGASYRLARLDKGRYPKIITAGKKAPYYTNSTHLPVGYTNNLVKALRHQDDLQVLYNGGTVFHSFLGEAVSSVEGCKLLVRKIAENFRIPYYTLTPTFSICMEHGYLAGEYPKCPKCGKETEVYSRVVGYYRPVRNWHIGKQEEFRERQEYDEQLSIKAFPS